MVVQVSGMVESNIVKKFGIVGRHSVDVGVWGGQGTQI